MLAALLQLHRIVSREVGYEVSAELSVAYFVNRLSLPDEHIAFYAISAMKTG